MAKASKIQTEVCVRKLFLLMDGFDIESCVVGKSMEKLKLAFCLARDIIDRQTAQIKAKDEIIKEVAEILHNTARMKRDEDEIAVKKAWNILDKVRNRP